MTIDANLIEGFKLGVAVGVFLGLAIGFLIAAPIIYHVRKRFHAKRIDGI